MADFLLADTDLNWRSRGKINLRDLASRLRLRLVPCFKKSSRWAALHKAVMPEKRVYFRHSALKILEIHQVFLRFLP